MVLVLGTPDSGKSARAEMLAEKYAAGKKTLYLATMIPFGAEGRSRVEKHRRMREGKGFDTIECPGGLYSILNITAGNAVLLECVTNLVGNELHSPDHSGWSDDRLARYVFDEVKALSESASVLIAVSNSFKECDEYDDQTRRYVALVNAVNEKLRAYAHQVHDVRTGEWIVYENN